MRAIFVPVADRPECEVALATTFAMAKRLGADVIGCHIRPVPLEPGDWNMADLWSMSQAQRWPVPSEEQQAREAEAASKLFSQAAGQAGYEVSDEPGSAERPRAHWLVCSGTPGGVMPTLGAASDMIVVSRPPRAGGQKAWLVLTSALLESLRPVLLLPQEQTNMTGRRIAIAWNRGRMETLTLHAALPLIKTADDVVFLTVGSQGKVGPTTEDMVNFLAIHGVQARARAVDREDEGAALVEASAAEGADLLLAGAYTRGRFRELIFGGVTEYLLSKADMPVLMMHA